MGLEPINGGISMSSLLQAIDHVQLAAPVNSEDIAREFYHNVLGLSEIEKPLPLRKRGGVWFQWGQVAIHIGIEEPFTPQKKAHPAFQVKHLNDLKEHLRLSDIPFIEDDRLPGADRIYVSDPFANRLEFLEWKKNKRD